MIIDWLDNTSQLCVYQCTSRQHVGLAGRTARNVQDFLSERLAIIIDNLSVGDQIALILFGNIAMLDEHELQDENTLTPRERNLDQVYSILHKDSAWFCSQVVSILKVYLRQKYTIAHPRRRVSNAPRISPQLIRRFSIPASERDSCFALSKLFLGLFDRFGQRLRSCMVTTEQEVYLQETGFSFGDELARDQILVVALILVALTIYTIVPVEILTYGAVNDKLKNEITVTATAIEPLDSPKQRPTIQLQGRRRTTSSLGQPEVSNTDRDNSDDTLTRIGNLIKKIHGFSIVTRYALYVLPVATFLVIPLALFDTVYQDARAGNIRLLGLFIWLEVVWVGLWVCKLLAKALPVIFQGACGLISTGIRKYSLVLMALEIPISLFLASIANWATVPVICSFDKGHCGDQWLKTLHTVCLATIAVAAVFLAEKFFVQLISINYHRKQYDRKIKDSKRLISILDIMYDASRQLSAPFSHEFAELDYDIFDPDTSGIKKKLGQAGFRTTVINDIGRARDKVTSAFGNIASEISGKHIFNPNSAHSIVIGALETRRASKALARRLWLSFVPEGKDVLLVEDIREVLGPNQAEEADEIFNALDKDCNGDVSLDEMIMLVMEVGQERKNRASSMHDISQAIQVLDQMLVFAVFVAIAFIYAAFFSKTLASKTAQLWSVLTGLAFAIGGTVTEFLGCCIFLFVKHPYDVGDRVDIDKTELVVERISLMYSVFRRVDNDKTVQVSHAVANTLWIENVSRSKAMKERINLSVSAATTSADINALRVHLEEFVRAAENARDYQSDIEVEVVGVGNLDHLDLMIEIKHKSNFSNEALRASRRNKFMIALLSAIKNAGIEAPNSHIVHLHCFAVQKCSSLDSWSKFVLCICRSLPSRSKTVSKSSENSIFIALLPQRVILPIPRSEMNHGKHDPNIIAKVWLSSMPKPEVAYDDRTLFHNRLAGPSFLLALFKQMLGDPATGSIALLAFLCGQRSNVWDVDHKSEWWECTIAGHEGQSWFRTEYRGRDLCSHRIEKDRRVEVALCHWRVLLDVARASSFVCSMTSFNTTSPSRCSARVANSRLCHPSFFAISSSDVTATVIGVEDNLRVN
ncbi:phytanoyl-CoA dioxygenase family protein, partial [Aureobasidium melanogenum]